MFTITYMTLAAWAIGFAATVVLARYLTPRRWWHNANARVLIVLVGGTWGIATLAQGWLPPAMAQAAPASITLAAGAHYRVDKDLNLRSSPGVDAARQAVLPAGSLVWATGQRKGDWWELRYRDAGKESTGWSSSLWLRRTDESAR